MNCPITFRHDEPDSSLWEEDCTIFGPLPPRPTLPDEHDHRTRIPNSALCILLSLAVHFSLVAMPGHAPSPSLVPVMELSLGIMDESGTGGSARALPGDGAPAPGPTRQRGEPVRTEAPPAPMVSPVVRDHPPKEPVQRTAPKIAPAKKSPRPVPKTRSDASQSTRTPRHEEPVASTESTSSQAVDETAPDMQGAAPDSGNPGPAETTMAGDGGSGNGKAGLGPGQGSGAGKGNGGVGNSGVLVFGSAEGPSFARQVRPKYPRLAVARREQGTVKLMIHLDEKGRLLNVKVVESAGPRLDEAALEAARASAYLPAIQAGNTIACRATLLMRFALKG